MHALGTCSPMPASLSRRLTDRVEMDGHPMTGYFGSMQHLISPALWTGPASSQASTNPPLSGKQGQVVARCVHTACRETDHAAEDCALASLREKPRSSERESYSPPPNSKIPRRSFQAKPYSRQNQEPVEFCISWNRGQCLFGPGCKMQHYCATCRRQLADHKAKDCTRTPEDILYKQPYKPLSKKIDLQHGSSA